MIREIAFLDRSRDRDYCTNHCTKGRTVVLRGHGRQHLFLFSRKNFSSANKKFLNGPGKLHTMVPSGVKNAPTVVVGMICFDSNRGVSAPKFYGIHSNRSLVCT